MVLVGGLVGILGFMIFVKLFGLVARTTKVAKVAKFALEVIRDPNLDDLQKETATRQYAKELFSLFLMIATGSLLALAIPMGVVWLMESANLLTVAEVVNNTLTLEFLGVATALSVILFLLSKRRIG